MILKWNFTEYQLYQITFKCQELDGYNSFYIDGGYCADGGFGLVEKLLELI